MSDLEIGDLKCEQLKMLDKSLWLNYKLLSPNMTSQLENDLCFVKHCEVSMKKNNIVDCVGVDD